MEISQSKTDSSQVEISAGEKGGQVFDVATLYDSDKESTTENSWEESCGKQDKKILRIRNFKFEDTSSVQSICYNHFKSLTWPTLRFWFFGYAKDFFALCLIMLLFVPTTSMLYSIIVFISWLYLRAYTEILSYIQNDCPDLQDITGTYMQPKGSCFWVAELDGEKSASDISTDKGKGVREIVGCVGIAPFPDDTTIAQLMRLVVQSNYRRMKIGSKLLKHAENYARANGYREMRILNNNLNPESLRFVARSGYELLRTIRRGLMRGDLIVWKKKLAAEAATSEGETKCSGAYPGLARLSSKLASQGNLSIQKSPGIDVLNGHFVSALERKRGQCCQRRRPECPQTPLKMFTC